MNYQEKRREPRQAAAGALRFKIAGDNGMVEASLIDTSSHGFRASHKHVRLSTGQEVYFQCGDVEGRARVIWTRIMGGDVQSGFLVLMNGD